MIRSRAQHGEPSVCHACMQLAQLQWPKVLQVGLIRGPLPVSLQSSNLSPLSCSNLRRLRGQLYEYKSGRTGHPSIFCMRRRRCISMCGSSPAHELCRKRQALGGYKTRRSGWNQRWIEVVQRCSTNGCIWVLEGQGVLTCGEKQRPRLGNWASQLLQDSQTLARHFWRGFQWISYSSLR